MFTRLHKTWLALPALLAGCGEPQNRDDPAAGSSSTESAQTSDVSQKSGATSGGQEEGDKDDEGHEDTPSTSTGHSESSGEQEDSLSTSEGDKTSETDSESETSGDEAGDTGPGEDQSITVFDGVPIYFGGEEDNHRAVDREVKLPTLDKTFASIEAKFSLDCYNGLCDHWDRLARIYVVDAAGTAEERAIEVARFITPYRVGFSDSFDLTDLRPWLAGTTTLRIFIDTWVAPGHEDGDGWTFDLELHYTGGTPDREVVELIPLWGDAVVEYGTIDQSIPSQLPERRPELSGEASAHELRTLITGHSYGNVDNCAEFCAKEHHLLVNGVKKTTRIWRDDCPSTGASGQQGNWTYARAGWCPGAVVHPWQLKLDDLRLLGQVPSFHYDVEPYDNRCHPDRPDCGGCVAGVSCQDGHGLPLWAFSSILIGYR